MGSSCDSTDSNASQVLRARTELAYCGVVVSMGEAALCDMDLESLLEHEDTWAAEVHFEQIIIGKTKGGRP